MTTAELKRVAWMVGAVCGRIRSIARFFDRCSNGRLTAQVVTDEWRALRKTGFAAWTADYDERASRLPGVLK